LSVDGDQAVYDVATLEALQSNAIVLRSFFMLLLITFAVLALMLAVVGIYGVMSYAVTQRTQEIGIRMALGAGAGDVLKLILRNGLTLTASGVVIGLAGAFVLTRLLAALLFGVRPTDALTFTSVSLTLVIAALVACYLPARRAAKVDPLVALRSE
jgi:putative ABC transport system permease protein